MFTRLYDRTLTLSRQRRIALALLLGALSALALPPWHIVPLVIPAFAGLLWLLDGAVLSPRPRRTAFATAWLFGLGHFLVGVHWIAEPFLVDAARHGWLIPFALAGMAGGLALFPAIAGLATALLARRFALAALSRALAFAAIWVLLEWVRSWLFTGFPWNLTGYVWAGTPEVMQAAAFAGIFGVSLLTVIAGAVPAVLGTGAGARAGLAVLLFTVLLPAAVWVGGAMRLGAAPVYDANNANAMVPGVRLRLVQANIPQRQKWQPQLRAGHLQRHVALSRQAPAIASTPAPTHVIWPETAAPFFLANDPVVRAAAAIAAPRDGVLITGAPRRSGDTGNGQFWNAAHAITGDGQIVASYDKAHLVPFGEYVPLRGVLPIDKLVPGQGDFTPGAGRQTIAIPGLPPVSPLICYEAIFPGAAARSDARPGWLLNLTNDAWFGTFAGPQQHFAISATRAVEEGLPLVRAANTGISAIVDPYGRPVAMLGLGAEGVIDSGLPRALAAPTPYARWGNAIPAGLLVIVGLSVILLQTGRRRPVPSISDSP
ncbi:MAG: apolipoprotein N-acyltransferase [Alphaproteobacteria bacterium]|nr:apolipoprotein N-acyltransferase [Alphaproteobacteria bacterium]